MAKIIYIENIIERRIELFFGLDVITHYLNLIFDEV